MEHAWRRSGACSSAIAAKGALSEVATSLKPGGSAVTRSPWLIQTGCCSPDLPDAIEQSALRCRPRPRRGRIRGRGRPRPCRRAAPPSPAGHSRCRGPARRPSKTSCGARGRVLVSDRCRAAGQDDRLRREPAKASGGVLEGMDFAIDARLAHAARDQLRHLRAEIDDEDLVVCASDLLMEFRLVHRRSRRKAGK